MIPTDAQRPRATVGAWGGLLTRARLGAYDFGAVASRLVRIEDVVPEGELKRHADLLDELSPGRARRRRRGGGGGLVRRLPVLRQLTRLREELAAISEFCDAAATAFAELAKRIEEVERRLDSSDAVEDR